MGFGHFVIVSVLVAATAAEVTTFRPCRDVPRDHCSISEVRITPCEDKGKCALTLGSDAALSFDFTPNFSASKLKTMVSYHGENFPGLGDDNACLYTSCPLAAGVQQTFNYNLHIGEILPKGTYPIVWKVWNEENAEEVCCFSTTIKLRKS